VAGVVGLIMSCIFGPIDEATEQQAVTMGNAMQLTNILRDVKEDFARGRIYLPREDLAKFKVSEADITAGRMTARFVDLMQFEIARARNLYRGGAAGLCKLADDGSRSTAAAMAVIYSGILVAIERQQYDVFTRRAGLSFWQKIARIPLARRLARRDEGQPIPEVFS
jgi:phytoene synthase